MAIFAYAEFNFPAEKYLLHLMFHLNWNSFLSPIYSFFFRCEFFSRIEMGEKEAKSRARALFQQQLLSTSELLNNVSLTVSF